MNSRAKGAAGERELSEFLRAHGYPDSRRGQQRSGLDQDDVIGGPAGWHIECKRVEKLNVWDAFEQAKTDAGERQPMVAMRRNRSEWLAVVKLETLLGLVRQLDAFKSLQQLRDVLR